jgi:alpha-L-fucosidase
MHLIADYFNTAGSWGKEVYVNNKGPKGRHNWPEGVGCREKDNLRLDKIGPKWQNPATLGTSYGYMKAEEENDAYKSPAQLIHLLCDVVSKNGNLLLNIGPRADGTFAQGMQKRLLAIGKWLETNGEAIYGTRPWVSFQQNTPNLRFTNKGRTLYAIALEKPTQAFVISMDDASEKLSVAQVSLLGSDTPVKWSRDREGIRIFPPSEWPGEFAWIFRITKNANH